MPINWPWSPVRRPEPVRPPAPTPQQPQPGNPATKPKKMSRLAKGGAAAAALAVSTIGGFEGYSSVAYPDPATMGHPWTICYGSTEGVTPGMRKSLDECKALLLKEMESFSIKIDSCLTLPVASNARYVGYLSLAYNIGTGGFCKSSIARLHNAGREREACEAILLYNRAAGKVMRGLQKRREAERRLCLMEG